LNLGETNDDQPDDERAGEKSEQAVIADQSVTRAGSRKMPVPMIVLMAIAVKSQRLMPRTSFLLT
jgi:hypothetical protein